MAPVTEQQIKPSLLAQPVFSDSRVYPTLFSPNGALLAIASQDLTLRTFRYSSQSSASTTPPTLELHATFHSPSTTRQWAITDATIDDTSAHVAFSTLPSSRIALANLQTGSATPRVLSIPTGPIWRNPLGHMGTTADLARWSILCLRFMHGANAGTIVAGLTDNGVAVVDVQAANGVSRLEDTASSSEGGADCEARGVCKINGAHADHVNAVCPMSAAQSALFLSGGDDGLVKMWDLRTDTAAAVGVLRGHRAGITSLDATRDGHGAVSVGKDQCVKVWDLRKMEEPSLSLTNDVEDAVFDYRFHECPAELMVASKEDKSTRTLRDGWLHGKEAGKKWGMPGWRVPTFKVATTLVKARYWPADERFVAAGSADGRVRVWNVYTGELVRRWDVDSTEEEIDFEGSRDAVHVGIGNSPVEQSQTPKDRSSRRAWVVRDVSWHPTEPVLAAGWWGNRRGRKRNGGAAEGGMSVYDVQGCLAEDEDWVEVTQPGYEARCEASDLSFVHTCLQH